MDKREKVQEVISEIFELVTGGESYEPSIDLSELEMGFEELLECTEIAFALDEEWTGSGSEVNGTLDQYVSFVAQAWNGEEVNEEWQSVLGEV